MRSQAYRIAVESRITAYLVRSAAKLHFKPTGYWEEEGYLRPLTDLVPGGSPRDSILVARALRELDHLQVRFDPMPGCQCKTGFTVLLIGGNGRDVVTDYTYTPDNEAITEPLFNDVFRYAEQFEG